MSRLEVVCAFFLFFLAFIILMGCADILKYKGILTGRTPVHEEVSSERARFMLECTHDWMLSADECRAILQGEDPPPPREGC